MATHTAPATTDAHNGGFTQVPNAIMKNSQLSQGSRLLYNILLSYCWHKDYCFPSYETLMHDMQCSSQALTTYLTELKDNNVITIVRRGQGKTNLYYLSEVVQAAPQLQPEPAGEAEGCSLKIKEQEPPKSKTEEYSVKENKGTYYSNSRIGKDGGRYYVNFQSHTNQQQPMPPVTQQTRVEQYKIESTPTARNIEKIEPQKNSAPAPRQTRLERDNGLTLYEDIQRGLLLEYMSDFAQEFNDQAPIQSSITRAYNLLQQSGLTMDAFTTYLYTARAVTKERTGSIRKYTERGVKTQMAYFFAVLEDRLGLRQKPFLALSQTP